MSSLGKELTLYQIDAFTNNLFSGNPAAIIKLDAFLPDELMQNIAAENNLSETAFIVPKPRKGHAKHFNLRWFTPTTEIDFCGHATLATAHALYSEYKLDPPFHFHTKVGELITDFKDGHYCLDAPIFPAEPTPITPAMAEAFPVPLASAFLAGPNLYIVFENARDIYSTQPDMSKIIPLSNHGVGITAKSDDHAYDCVSRFFVPAEGIDEDPVTGSAHAAIGPFWGKILKKKTLKAFQASKRGGTLYLTLAENRLIIAGQAVTYMKGRIKI